jgi:hypothetical protein
MATSPPDPVTCLLYAIAIILAYITVLHLFLFHQTLTQLLILLLSWMQSATSSITSSKSKVPQVNPVIRPARDPEKQGTRAKPSGDWVPRDQISNRSPDPSRVLSRDKSRDSTRFGWARSPLINKWQTVGTVHNQRRHVTPVIG